MVCGSGLKAVMNAYLSCKQVWDRRGSWRSQKSDGSTTISRFSSGTDGSEDEFRWCGLCCRADRCLCGISYGSDCWKCSWKIRNLPSTPRSIYNSQLKAIHAQDTGAFDSEIVPVVVKNRRGESIVERDEYINRETTLDSQPVASSLYDGRNWLLPAMRRVSMTGHGDYFSDGFLSNAHLIEPFSWNYRYRTRRCRSGSDGGIRTDWSS